MRNKPSKNLDAALFRAAGLKASSKRIQISPSRWTLIGFAVLILIGTLLLWLPFSVQKFEWGGLLTAFFTATSAVCVTGLSVVDVSQHFTVTGQVILLGLIQLGGLGYMMLYSLMLLAVGKRFSLRDKLSIQKVLDLPGPGGVITFVRRILVFTLIFEALGAILLSLFWIPEFGLKKGLSMAIFHSISAFNNAGFALFHDSLISYQSHPGIMFVIAFLVIAGAMGYPVISELWNKAKQDWKERKKSGGKLKYLKWGRLTIHTRICLWATLGLLAFGTVAFFILEMNNPQTMANASLAEKLLMSFFQSVMPRTAGFNALPMDGLSQSSLFLMLTFMLIGANPGGTGGGIKTTTAIVLVLQALAVIRGKSDTVVYQRRIGQATLTKSMTTVLISLAWINTVTILLTLTEKQPLMPVLFESVSAFATVGLSTGITGQLSVAGQFLIIITMYAGRVGVITLGASLWQERNENKLVKYPEENLIVS